MGGFEISLPSTRNLSLTYLIQIISKNHNNVEAVRLTSTSFCAHKDKLSLMHPHYRALPLHLSKMVLHCLKTKNHLIASVKTEGEINLLFLNGGVITPLFPKTNRGSSFHLLVIGPIRRALPHRDKREAAFRTGGKDQDGGAGGGGG